MKSFEADELAAGELEAGELEAGELEADELVGGIGLPSMEECCSYMVVGTDELEADELEADELTEPRLKLFT